MFSLYYGYNSNRKNRNENNFSNSFIYCYQESNKEKNHGEKNKMRNMTFISGFLIALSSFALVTTINANYSNLFLKIILVLITGTLYSFSFIHLSNSVKLERIDARIDENKRMLKLICDIN